MSRPATDSRSDVVSSFTVIKGALIEETYTVLGAWRFDLTKRENLDAVRDGSVVSAKGDTWRRDVAWVISRRLDPGGRDRPLAIMAKSGMRLDEWKPLLLWHMTRDEFLVRDFLAGWLCEARESGAFRLRPEDLLDYLKRLPERGARMEHAWSDRTTPRVAAGLLKLAVDFGLLTGSGTKEFASYHLPEASFLYLLHAIRDEQVSPARVVACSDWRLWFMDGKDVERELLRLHQFRKLEYQVAGSLTELRLPFASLLEFAERWAA